MDAIWIDLSFGHHGQDISVDFGSDGIIDWGFIEPAQGNFGRQSKFWIGENNGVSQSNTSEKILLDVITGIGSGGFFLLPFNSEIVTFNVDISEGTITSANSSTAYELRLSIGTELFLDC